jgi:hypothetical protein
MTVVIIKPNQSIFDISVQMFGSAQVAIEIALLNDLSITDKLIPGQELVIPEISTFENGAIKSFYSKNNIKPATAETIEGSESVINEMDGIGYMVIESTFIVR